MPAVPRHNPGRGRVAALCALSSLIAAAFPAHAAAESCTYDAAAKSVSASITPGSEATLRVAADGALLFGLDPEPCGAATTANTDSISIAGSPGTSERLTLDESAGFLGPGATAETNLPEVETAVSLGDADDEVVVLATAGNDAVAMGQNGLSLNSDGDVDVTFAPLPLHVEIRGGGGVNVLTGRGGWGAGAAFAGRVSLFAGDLGDELSGGNGDDLLVGGAGPDVASGNAGDDRLEGEGGNDRLSGGEGKDYIVGDGGADALIGGFGNDFLVASDGSADTQINGGPDMDIAFYDPGLDPVPSATEGIFAGPPTEACTYDAVAKTVTARLEPGSQATLEVAADGRLLFGVVPIECGAATTANTDSIQVEGAPGLAETLTIDQSQGFLGPGATAEPNLPEIEVTVNLGDTADVFALVGGDGDDTLTAGLSGVSLNADGDVDVTFSPLPSRIELHGRGGANFLTGRGGFGAGLAYPGTAVLVGGPLADELNGGTGDDFVFGNGGGDVLSGSGGHDELDGGPGDDRLSGGDGNDVLLGGPGADDLLGGFHDDFIDANDDEADIQIHGGPGTDTAYYDAAFDPPTIAVENAVADPGEEPPPPPPPPAPGTCAYNGASNAVTASMPAAGEATLAVVAGEIRFGAAPVACGAATTLNTDLITVLGVTGAAERLVLDQSAGAFAPGAAAETNIPEIELELALGDAADTVVVVGTAGNDSIAAGLNGVGLNGDGDVDVTFSTLPGTIEIHGGGGVNVITGRGGSGAGLAFAGSLTIVGGDLGDELSGGNGNDVIHGGAGADTISGNAGHDGLFGLGGDDLLSGGEGNDLLVGGAGADNLLGGFDADVIEADDDEADVQIHGGPGADTAYVDDGLDPATIAVETRIPR